MREVKISVEVTCKWAVKPPAYRIYVDDDLLTERSYIWGPNQFVKENIIVNIDAGPHTFRLEPVNPNIKGFEYANFKVDGAYTRLDNNVFQLP